MVEEDTQTGPQSHIRFMSSFNRDQTQSGQQKRVWLLWHNNEVYGEWWTQEFDLYTSAVGSSHSLIVFLSPPFRDMWILKWILLTFEFDQDIFSTKAVDNCEQAEQINHWLELLPHS